MSSQKKVYFDTCVFLAVFLEEQDRLEASTAALQCALDGQFLGHVSALTVAETIGAQPLRAPQGPPNPEFAMRLDRARDYFRETTQLRFVDITQRVGDAAMAHAVDFGLKGPDALHLALAEFARCDELHTYDRDLLDVGEQVAGLKVVTPWGEPQSRIEVP